MTSSPSRPSGTSAPGPGAAWIAPPTAKAPPRARVTRRGATAATRGAVTGMTGPTRCRSQLRVAPEAPIVRVAGAVNSPGSSPWAAGVGRLQKRKRAGGKAAASSFIFTPDAFTTPARGDDHRGLLSGPASSSCRGFVFSGGRSGEAAEGEEAGGKAVNSEYEG